MANYYFLKGEQNDSYLDALRMYAFPTTFRILRTYLQTHSIYYCFFLILMGIGAYGFLVQYTGVGEDLYFIELSKELSFLEYLNIYNWNAPWFHDFEQIQHYSDSLGLTESVRIFNHETGGYFFRPLSAAWLYIQTQVMGTWLDGYGWIILAHLILNALVLFALIKTYKQPIWAILASIIYLLFSSHGAIVGSVASHTLIYCQTGMVCSIWMLDFVFNKKKYACSYVLLFIVTIGCLLFREFGILLPTLYLGYRWAFANRQLAYNTVLFIIAIQVLILLGYAVFVYHYNLGAAYSAVHYALEDPMESFRLIWKTIGLYGVACFGNISLAEITHEWVSTNQVIINTFSIVLLLCLFAFRKLRFLVLFLCAYLLLAAEALLGGRLLSGAALAMAPILIVILSEGYDKVSKLSTRFLKIMITLVMVLWIGSWILQIPILKKSYAYNSSQSVYSLKQAVIHAFQTHAFLSTYSPIPLSDMNPSQRITDSLTTPPSQRMPLVFVFLNYPGSGYHFFLASHLKRALGWSWDRIDPYFIFYATISGEIAITWVASHRVQLIPLDRQHILDDPGGFMNGIIYRPFPPPLGRYPVHSASHGGIVIGQRFFQTSADRIGWELEFNPHPGRPVFIFWYVHNGYHMKRL